MKRVGPLSVVGLLLLFAPGCVALGLVPAGYTPLPVLSPETFEESRFFRLKVTVIRDGNRRQFPAAVEIHPDRMVIIGFGGMSRLFTIRIRDGSFQVENNQDESIPFRRLAADLQWSLWKQIPERAGYQIEETETGDGVKRVIFRDGARVADVHFSRRPPWSETITYNNSVGYTLRIRTVETNPLTNGDG